MATIYRSRKYDSWILSHYFGRDESGKVLEFRKQSASKDELLAIAAERGWKVRYGQRSPGRKTRNRADVIAHLAANFEVSAEGCWLWTGRLTNAGYAAMTWNPTGRRIPGAHRVVLHALGFPVPEDKVVDHLCRVPHCINPDHLEVVAQRENIMRSPIAPGALNAAKTRCNRGHEYTPDNTVTYVNPGGRKTVTRVCRTCQRGWVAAAAAKRAAKKKAAVA